MNEVLYERALAHGMAEPGRYRRPARSAAFYRAWMASAKPTGDGHRLIVWDRPSSNYREEEGITQC